MAEAKAEKLNKALKMANDAVKEMGNDTKIALNEDLGALKDALAGTNVGKKIVDAKEYSVEKVKEFGAKMDDSVRERPYHYIAGAAVVGVLVGALLGRKN